MRLPPDRTYIDIGDYGKEDIVRAAAIVKRIAAVAARAREDLSEFDRAQLQGMLLFGRQIARANRRLNFGASIVSASQLEEMVQDELIQVADLHEGTSVWNLSEQFWSALGRAQPRFRPRRRQTANPLKATADEMEFLERARGVALLESVPGAGGRRDQLAISAIQSKDGCRLRRQVAHCAVAAAAADRLL